MTNICSMIIKTPTYNISILENDNVLGQFKKNMPSKSDFIGNHKNVLQFLHLKFQFLRQNMRNRLFKTY